MELRKLKSFLIVAKELHFGKAAEKLNITQPALTHQIQQLESELGFELFDKAKRVNNRKVELTEAGIYLMKEVSRIIDLLERTLINAKTNSIKSKQIKLGLPKIFLVNEVVFVLKKLQKKFPDNTFKIIEYSTVLSVQEALFKGNIDIGITTLPLVFKGLDYQIFQKEFLNVIMPKNHPLAKYQKIKIEQLRNDKWVEFTKDLCSKILEDIEIYCRNEGFSRDANIVQEVSSIELLLGMVSAGIGVAIFPSHSLTNLDGIFSKELIFSDNTRLEQTKIIAYKESMEQKYIKVLNESF
jgi:DNA-binding transcriptional LysR family regulator